MIEVQLITGDSFDGDVVWLPCLPPAGAFWDYRGLRYTVARVIFETFDVHGGTLTHIKLFLESR